VQIKNRDPGKRPLEFDLKVDRAVIDRNGSVNQDPNNQNDQAQMRTTFVLLCPGKTFTFDRTPTWKETKTEGNFRHR
jgi:hypothetical protein